MPFLTVAEVQQIKEHMISNDSKSLNIKYKAKSKEYDMKTIEFGALDSYKKDGWEELPLSMKTGVKIQKKKSHSRQFEDDMWCMFYNLGFETLNYDDKLIVRWGDKSTDKKQLDVVAVGEDAIFIVECKAAVESKQASFKDAIDNLINYKPGLTKALKQIYGEEKKVKFIFATRNFRFQEDSEDLKRLNNNGIYHFNENTYSYVNSLIKSYKDSVIYQFYGLMFKDEIINNERICVPALKGIMGGNVYYMLSIKPSTLLKIGFVLHRTKVNDSLAPTYQRLLVPKRLKGITNFIEEGGYFPNSIIINFISNEKKKKLKVYFEPYSKDDGTKSKFGILSIPNAYGIAYIIDGQHRVYGYAGSHYKDTNTIPVVAFVNMPSKEQLQIFMDINENQKAVSPSLKLDLAEDINWDSDRNDSRLLALRSSIIKQLGKNANSPLYNKISVGEDVAELAFKPFDSALAKSSLLPKATNSSYTKDTDVCLYDCLCSDNDKTMNDSKKRICNLLYRCYFYIKSKLDDEKYNRLIISNRGTYAFIVLIGSLNKHSIQNGLLTQKSTADEQMVVLEPYLTSLANYLNNIPKEHYDKIILSRGQGADILWLRMFQDAIHKDFDLYNPEGLEEWKETQDEEVQKQGRELGNEIEKILHKRVLEKLKELHGDSWENSIFEVKTRCLTRISEKLKGDDSLSPDDYDWVDMLQISDYKDIIEKYWINKKEGDEGYKTFEDEFSIRVDNDSPFKSRKDKTQWLSLLNSYKDLWNGSSKGKSLNRSQVNILQLILESLQITD